MATAASVDIELRAESARLRSDLDRVTKRVKQFGRRNQSTFDRLAASGARAMAGVGAAAVAAGAAMTALAISAAKTADQLAKTADKLGVGTKEMAGLQLAAKLTGVETSKLNAGLQRMVRRVSEAARGTGEAQGALRELGIDARELNKLAPDEQFKRIGDALGSVDSQSDKIRLAFKLFDSEGVDLIRTLELQREGLEATQREAEAFGTALSRVDAKQIEMAGDQITRARELVKGIGTTAATQGSVFVGAFAKAFADAGVEADGFKGVVSGAMRGLAIGVGLVANLVNALRASLVGAKNALLELQRLSLDGGGVLEAIRGTSESVLFNFGFEQASKAIGADRERAAAIAQEIEAGNQQIADLVEQFRNIDAWGEFFDEAQRQNAARAAAALSALPSPGGLASSSEDSEGGFDFSYDPQNDPVLVAARKRQQELMRIGKELQAEAELRAKNEVALQEWAEREKTALKQRFTNSALGLLQTLGSRSKKLQAAAIVIEKALAIKSILLQAKRASMLAFATQLVPGDPSSFARAIAAKKATLALGTATAAATAATGLAQIAQISSGDAAPGSAANPLFTQPVGQQSITTAQEQGPRNIVTINVQGDLVGDSAERILEELRDRIDNGDEVIFSSDSRQALELSGG